MDNNKTITRSLYNSFGGKFLIAKTIISIMPAHSVYVELFGGAGSVLMRKPPVKIEVINDLDAMVFNLYRVIRDEKMQRKLFKELKRTGYAREELRLAMELCDDPVESARRLIVRSLFSFHPRYTLTPSGQQPVFATHMERIGPRIFDGYIRHLPKIMARFRNVSIENVDAIKLINRFDSDKTLFYADPPYVSITRASSGQYNHEATDSQHEALLIALSKIDGMAMVSGYDSELYNDIIGNWLKITIPARSFNSDKKEIVWLSPNCKYELS